METQTLAKIKSILITSVDDENLQFHLVNEHSEVEATGKIKIVNTRKYLLTVDNPETQKRLYQGIEQSNGRPVATTYNFKNKSCIFEFKRLPAVFQALNTWC